MFGGDFSLLSDEKILVLERCSLRVLFFPALFFVVLSALFGFCATVVFRQSLYVGVLGVGFLIFFLLFIFGVVKPFLVWANSCYVLTNSRIIFSKGLLRKHTQEIYLTQITNVVFERSLLQRLFGCGNIRFDSSNDLGRLYFLEVDNIKNFRTELNLAIQNLPSSQNFLQTLGESSF